MKILNKPLAIYFEILKYSNENIEYIKENFQILKLENPSQLFTLKDKGNVRIIFAPLGYDFNMVLFKKFPNLKVLISNTTSIPHINENDANLMKIKICALHDEKEFLDTITPTAEHTIGLIVAASRRIIGAHHSVVNGMWERKNWGAPFMLSRSKLGIIGFGRLGKMVAKIASSIGMEIYWYDPNCSSGEYIKSESLIHIAENCDVISLHAKHNNLNTNFINKQFFDAMKPNAIFVNTARGELVDNIALLNALKNKQIWGRCIRYY
jgi:Phosphoglycerate dehydrogenase and related dehydrogenases